MRRILSTLGLETDDWEFGFVAPDQIGARLDAGANALAVDLGTDYDITRLTPCLDQIDMIRISLPAFTDGRAFSQAGLLRLMGYSGRLRAAGVILPDQFRALLRVGFDEIEIPPGIRAPARTDAHSPKPTYQERLRQFEP
ncbi:MAG: DUF934 domain-containing protein [Paracoccaceae bacterium]|nr:DUF934 domain-containing protein [Paracoccaceae bacterium]